mmetsp:Transcript_8151/g.12914  ORF Transcript_8151/g.12914 Transcript_8151/m.12914 type:complete len:146 (+) Transcript_8151:65-502(+)|eukprot:CAMPEP_0184328692 /NCGR_PEP_ID=MMETSP1049-20130417/143756_1 /TAXON_ID=77928 /ORGANISM="Proteomonas sulcata, Strain CCMP704" /LENGTH=145 /DNA_ID=CAMNT_0026651017 /DNA_START=435 /DNA_END=872 /DNA_ORIENTATION=+
MVNNPKLSTSLATAARTTALALDPKAKILRLYRHVQKEVPFLLKIYAIDEDVGDVRRNIKNEFMKHGTRELSPQVQNMLLFKGQLELDEAQAQWKTRTHILKYVYDVASKPHLARSKIAESPQQIALKQQSPFLQEFFAGDGGRN